MDIASEIAKEHSKRTTLKVADYVGVNINKFKVLVEVFLGGPYRISQRSSWPLTICVERHPHLIKPYLSKLLEFLNKPNIHDGVKRNLLRLLQFIDIPKRHHSTLINLCFDYLQDKNEPVAIKVFAMSTLATLTSDYPDLQRELRIILEDQLPYGSPGFRSRAMKVLKGLGKG